jgi:hypothetical protein
MRNCAHALMTWLSLCRMQCPQGVNVAVGSPCSSRQLPLPPNTLPVRTLTLPHLGWGLQARVQVLPHLSSRFNVEQYEVQYRTPAGKWCPAGPG